MVKIEIFKYLLSLHNGKRGQKSCHSTSLLFSKSPAKRLSKKLNCRLKKTDTAYKTPSVFYQDVEREDSDPTPLHNPTPPLLFFHNHFKIISKNTLA